MTDKHKPLPEESDVKHLGSADGYLSERDVKRVQIGHVLQSDNSPQKWLNQDREWAYAQFIDHCKSLTCEQFKKLSQ